MSDYVPLLDTATPFAALDDLAADLARDTVARTRVDLIAAGLTPDEADRATAALTPRIMRQCRATLQAGWERLQLEGLEVQ